MPSVKPTFTLFFLLFTFASWSSLDTVYAHNFHSQDLQSMPDEQFFTLLSDHINNTTLAEQYSLLRLSFDEVPDRMPSYALVHLAKLEELQLNFLGAVQVYYYLYKKNNERAVGLRMLYLMTRSDDVRTASLLDDFMRRIDLETSEFYQTLLLSIQHYEKQGQYSEAEEYYNSLLESEFSADFPAQLYYQLYQYGRSTGNTILQGRAEALLETYHAQSLEKYLLFSPSIKPIPVLNEYLQVKFLELDSAKPLGQADELKNKTQSLQQINEEKKAPVSTRYSGKTAIQVAAFRAEANANKAQRYFTSLLQDAQTNDARYKSIAQPLVVFFETEGYYKLLFLLSTSNDSNVMSLLLRDLGIEGNLVEIK